MSDNLNPEALWKNRKYRIVYHDPNYRLLRETVARFLEEVDGKLVLDLRPEAGTTPLPIDQIQQMWETERPVQVPAPYRGETRVF